MKMKNLEFCFNKAIEVDANFVGILVKMDGFPEKELIINSKENIKAKLEYYKNTYDEDLNHKYSKGIRIVGFTYGERIKDVGEDLL
jgi:hypothetical protein